MTTHVAHAALIALGILLLAGCGDGTSAGNLDVSAHRNSTPRPLCYEIDGERAPGCPTPTSMPAS
jgi:hypothetical protein